MEIWKDIKGWEGKYFISNQGRLKSIGGKFTKLKPDGYITLGSKGFADYLMVTLRRPGESVKFRIHTLVGEAFVKKPKSINKLCINHIDGNKENNNDWNLEWITIGDNVRHAVKIGLMDFKGEKHPHAKLTSEKVLEIRRLRREQNITHEKLGEMFSVSRRQIGDVISGRNWGWLNPI